MKKMKRLSLALVGLALCLWDYFVNGNGSAVFLCQDPRGTWAQLWPQLKLDNDVSRDFTVLEIVTQDRPGTLYAIGRTLFVEGLDIHRSKIASEANRAIDVFYVRDKANLVKITDPERMVRLKTRLLDLLTER